MIFTQDYRAYAPSLAAYADGHFTLPSDAQFPSYAIYDCQKEGKFVAYPDANGSGNQDVLQGLEFLQQHQLQQAVDAFQRAREANPNHSVACLNLALLYYQLGRSAEGVAQCEWNIHHGISPAVSCGILGQFRERQGDFAAAREAYEESLKLDPRNQVTLRLLANLNARGSSPVAPAM